MASIQQTLDNFPNYTIQNNIGLIQGKVLVLANGALQQLIIFEHHNTPIGGHARIRRTLHRINSTFVWTDLKHHVPDFVNCCQICQMVNPFNRAPQGLLQPLPIPGNIWEAATIDFITHLPTSDGKTSILVVVDRLSRHAHFMGLPTKFMASIVTEVFIHDVVLIHGVSSSLVSDRDPLFLSKFW